MLKKENALLFPFDFNSSPMLRYGDMLKAYNIKSAVSPYGWGISGKYASEVDGGSFVDLKISSDFEQELEACDTVIIVESYNKIDFKEYILPMIKLAVNKGKNIVSLIQLGENTSKEIAGVCKERNLYFRSFESQKPVSSGKCISKEFERNHRIETPVVFVCGLMEYSQKFDVQLAVRQKMLEQGYRISQVGTKRYCELFGFHSFPQFMLDNTYSESNKVVLFNHFIKNIENSESPDLIIIGIPGGILPYDNIITNRFGILAYEISQAVLPDAVIVCTNYEDHPEEFFKSIRTSLKYKFGFEISCFNISNRKFDYEFSVLYSSLEFITLNSEFVAKKISAWNYSNIPLFNALYSNHSEKMADCIINDLSEEQNTEVI